MITMFWEVGLLYNIRLLYYNHRVYFTADLWPQYKLIEIPLKKITHKENLPAVKIPPK